MTKEGKERSFKSVVNVINNTIEQNTQEITTVAVCA